MHDDTRENIAQTVADLMRVNGAVEMFDQNKIDVDLETPLIVSVPDGKKLQNLTGQLREAQGFLKPIQRKGTAHMTTLQSVIDWANRFKGDESVLFAKNDDRAPSLTCIADYHLAGSPTIDRDSGDPTARHCNHRATYAFPLSKKWLAWMAFSGEGHSGVEMGAFLEDNILDVIDPPIQLTSPGIAGAEATESDLRLIDIARRLEGSYGNGAQLLGMAKSFTVNETADYMVANNSTTGEATIQVKSEHLDGTGQPIKVPKLFLIGIPVFENGPAYRLPVRFQYRKSGATVKFFLTVHDPRHAKDHAFDEAVSHAAAETGLPLMMGTPEA